jgi:hypothetical protein
MESNPGLDQPKEGGLAKFITGPVRKIKESFEQRKREEESGKEIKKICEGIYNDSIVLLKQHGERKKSRSFSHSNLILLFPPMIIPRSSKGETEFSVLRASVKEDNEEELKQVRMISEVNGSTVKISVTGDEYYLTLNYFYGELTNQSGHEKWDRGVTLEDAQRFRGIIEQVKQQMEGKSAGSGEVGEAAKGEEA